MNRLRDVYSNRWMRYGLTLFLLGLVALKVDPGRLKDALGSARPHTVVIALLLTFPFLGLKALRWSIMLRQGGVEASFAEATRSLIGGMGLALLTPARLGELVRVAYLRDAQKWKIGGLVMVDKAFDLLVLCGLSMPGAWLLLGPGAGALLLLATLIGLVLVYEPRPLSSALHAVSNRTPLSAQLTRAWSSLETLSPGATTVYLILTVLTFMVVVFQFGVILSSWRSWSSDVAFLTFPLVILTNVMPLTVGGLGVREGVAALLLAHYGVPAADAALAAFLMFTVNVALPGVAGALLVPTVSPTGATRLQSLDHP